MALSCRDVCTLVQRCLHSRAGPRVGVDAIGFPG
nr:MAG TPA: hypothetical protein [Caudoviricetes sp.]